MTKTVSRMLAAGTLATALVFPSMALATTDSFPSIEEIKGTAPAAANDPEDFGVWELNYSTDEFGRKSTDPDDVYIVALFDTGTFDNSATTGSELTAVIIINNLWGKPLVSIRLVEYGNRYPDILYCRFG